MRWDVWDMVILTTLTYAHSILKLSHTLRMILTPTPTTLVGDIIPILVGEDRVTTIKDDKVDLVITVERHLAIAKDNMTRPHHSTP